MDEDTVLISRAFVFNCIKNDTHAMERYQQNINKATTLEELDKIEREISVLMGRIQMAAEILKSSIIPHHN